MAAVVLPDWSVLVDLVSGRVLLGDVPLLDVSGVDVEDEGDVEDLGERSSSFFGGASRPAPVQPLLPGPEAHPSRGGLRLVALLPDPVVSSPVDVDDVDDGPGAEDEFRVRLFGDQLPDEEEDDE